MAKGILYIMTTAVEGLIKIGSTETNKYQGRMRKLERDGYYNITGLNRFFAIEVKDYKSKEQLLRNVFSTHRVGDIKSELFSLNVNLVQDLLLAFEGRVAYSSNGKTVYSSRILKKNSKTVDVKEKKREVIGKKKNFFSFSKKGIKRGDVITFYADKNITAKVVGDTEVEYLGEIYKLSTLAKKLYQKMGRLTRTATYQGAAHFRFKGELLKNLPDK